MKLRATLGETEVGVEVRRQEDGVIARVADREYELKAHSTSAGMTLITSDGSVFECRLDARPMAGQAVDVSVGTDHYAVTLIDPKRLRGAAGLSAHADGAARILAPMPGKVVRILVEPGASVEPGAGIIVVEAMKMQNEMKAPKAGTVTALNVEVGATVNGGDVLALIE